ncbi:MAG TPA: hypothetical protein VGK01_18870 [Candidatus Angelobacter sp.]|jgi:hypothetical protein
MVGKAAKCCKAAYGRNSGYNDTPFVVVHFLKDHHTMAEFCTNCGAPLSGLFCGRCGHRAQSASAPPQASPSPQPIATPTAQPVAVQQPAIAPQPASQQPAPITQPAATAPQPPTMQASASAPQSAQPSVTQQSVAQQPASSPQSSIAPPKSSGAGKALLIVGGIVLVLVLSAFGAVLYGVHWVKHKVSSITGGSFGSEVSQGNICKLLSTADLQQMIGVTVERSAEIMDGNDPGCAYYTNSAAFAQLQKLAIAQAKRDSEKVNKETDANAKSANGKSANAKSNAKNDDFIELMKHTKEMEGIVKGFGLSAPDPSGKVFSFSVDRNFGSGNWLPLRTTLSVVPGFDDVNGVGDHAMIGSFGHAFFVLKGDSMFKLDTIYLPEARLRGSEIANKIISNM